MVLSGLALGIGFLTTEWGAARTLGWLLVFPLAASAYLIISGTFGLCLYNGLTGQRAADHGPEVILDSESRARLRGRALMAVSASVLIACFLTVAFVASS